MGEKTVDEIAETFGLGIDGASGMPGNGTSFQVYKGAKKVFTGTETEVRNFFVRYERERPPLFAENSFGYKE